MIRRRRNQQAEKNYLEPLSYLSLLHFGVESRSKISRLLTIVLMTAVVTNIHFKVQEVVLCCAAIAWYSLAKDWQLFSFLSKCFLATFLGVVAVFEELFL
jgi:hypothetical protein